MGVNYDLTSNVSTNFSVYHTKIKDLIAYNAGTNTNIAKANFIGGEAGIKWHQDDLFLSTEYAYVKQKMKRQYRNCLSTSPDSHCKHWSRKCSVWN